MATVKRANRTICSICGKVPSLSFCSGCEKIYCEEHAEQHRKDLSSTLNQIVTDHNQCKQQIIAYNDQSVNHPLIQQITEWETRSIEKIRHAANDARKQVYQVLVQFSANTMNNVKVLTEQLTQAQIENNFIENDLRKWMETLTKLKRQLEKPPTIVVRKETSDVAFIPRIVVHICEIFDISAGKLSIKDDGRLIVNYGSHGYGTARSQGSYEIGKHKIRFKLENCGKTKWFVIGIISKTIPIEPIGYSTPSFYGWLANNFACLNGKLYSDYEGYRCDAEKNDVLELIVDCNQSSIRLTNERTHSSFEMPVDVKLCPLPWQVQVCLYYSKDRIRLMWK